MPPIQPTKQPLAPLIVGITGASGSVIGFRFVAFALQLGLSVELVMTEKALLVTFEELGLKLGGKTEADKARQLLQHLELPETFADRLHIHPNHKLDAPPASGTHRTLGMVVIPCSMGTLGRITHGIGDTLLTRAADVTLKEARPLILVPRECPLNLIHLKNLVAVAEAGAKVVPPVMTFYLPDFQSMDGQLRYICGKVFDLLGVDHQLHKRWGELNPEAAGIAVLQSHSPFAEPHL